jgi:hypothetical protein
MKEKRHKDEIKRDAKYSFVNNFVDKDFLGMMIRLDNAHPDSSLNSAEHLMCSILFRQTSFNNDNYSTLLDMKDLVESLAKAKPHFETKLKTYLKQIESALLKKQDSY